MFLAGSGASAPAAPPAAPEQAALAKPGVASSLASQRIYFVMPDRYANGDTSNDKGGLTGSANVTGYDPADIGYFHGGDLQGLTAHLQRIRDLGFTALWITPVLKQQTVLGGSAGYHGYWGLDFTSVDPHLGIDEDFSAMVARAHVLGLKVYLDVVVNHTGDVVTLSNGGTYSDIPFRDCQGHFFKAANYVTAKRFPCLAARYMPEVPYVAPGDRHLKKPEWLNDPLNYHDRGNIDFGSCSTQCFEQGDFFGLDDLFTEKPNVMKGLAQIYASWVTRFRVDGFRVDTAKHVNAAFFKLWVPRIRAAAKAVRLPGDFPIFGEVTLNDAVDLSEYVRNRGVPQVLDFPFQQVASAYAAGFSGAKGIAHRLEDDDYFRLPDGSDPAFPTFLGNHDMGRAAQQILSQAPGLGPDALVKHVELGYDLLYLLRGAPVVMYGDEVGMIGPGGDKAARQDMFPTQVTAWQKETRVGSPPIGKGSSFDVTGNPIAAQITTLSGLRDRYPALSTGASVVRYANGPVLVVSRIDTSTGTELAHGVQQRRQCREGDRDDRHTRHDLEHCLRHRHGDGFRRCEGGADDPAGVGCSGQVGVGDSRCSTSCARAQGGARLHLLVLLAERDRRRPTRHRRVRHTRSGPAVGTRRRRRLRAVPRLPRSTAVQEGAAHPGGRDRPRFQRRDVRVQGAHRLTAWLTWTRPCAERHPCHAAEAAFCCTSPRCREDGSAARPTNSSTGSRRQGSPGGRSCRSTRPTRSARRTRRRRRSPAGGACWPTPTPTSASPRSATSARGTRTGRRAGSGTPVPGRSPTRCGSSANGVPCAPMRRTAASR